MHRVCVCVCNYRSGQQRTYNIVTEHPLLSTSSTITTTAGTLQPSQKQIAVNGQQVSDLGPHCWCVYTLWLCPMIGHSCLFNQYCILFECYFFFFFIFRPIFDTFEWCSAFYIHVRQHQLHCSKSSNIDLNYRHPPRQTTNTSSSSSTTAAAAAAAVAAATAAKQSHFNQSHTVRYEGDTTTTTMPTNFVSFSNLDQIVHDINCAKNKSAYLNQTTNVTSNI